VTKVESSAQSGASAEATRAQLLGRALVCGGAVLGGGLVAWGLPQLSAASPSAEQDKRVLNLVLAVEYVEAAFYKEALAGAGLQGEVADYARVVAAHEQAHVDFLKKALGGAAEPEGSYDFGDATKDADAFAATAVELEDLAVSTYNGQAVNLTSPTLEAAARIVSVEARHAAWIRSILGKVPATEPVDEAIKEADTRAKLREIAGTA